MKRRTKGIVRFQDEQTALKMALLGVRGIEGHGVTMTQAVKALLARIRADAIYHGRYARGRTGGNRTTR